MAQARAGGAGPARGVGPAGFLLGFALGGFFDGILLHQILQWHHLLAGVAPSGTVGDLRFQVLADGLFHLATYAIALVGLGLGWRARGALAADGAGRRIAAWAAIGFGAWHLTDAVLIHWTLGLHRVRMDTAWPLLWDLGWAALFGVAPLAAGLRLLRAPPDGGGGGRAAAALALAAAVGGPVAALPPRDAAPGRALVAFAPGVDFAGAVTAIAAMDARPLWSDDAGGVWVVALPPGARASGFYRHGALLAAGGGWPAGCLGWSGV
jgi:uncharacterized membrane protein